MRATLPFLLLAMSLTTMALAPTAAAAKDPIVCVMAPCGPPSPGVTYDADVRLQDDGVFVDHEVRGGSFYFGYGTQGTTGATFDGDVTCDHEFLIGQQWHALYTC